MRMMIATGGTGGHIYPALALAEEIKRKDPAASILFVGSSDRMEAKEIPAAGYRFYSIQVSGTNGGLIRKAVSVFSMARSYFECLKLVRKEKPEAVIGFGNYISVPVILAAHHEHIVTMLHEQNSFAGKANRFLAKYADAIVGCYNENLDQFPKEKTRILGNPRAQAAASMRRDAAVVSQLGLDPRRPLAVIVMGSLGSESVNEVMKEALQEMEKKSWQALYVTGKNHYDDFVKTVKENQNLRIVPYIDGCRVMVNADLCVVRGGATTAAEITALKMPSIIIPSPYVPNNHQVKNAEALVKLGAAEMIEEKDLTAQRIIAKIEELILNPKRLQAMSQNAAMAAKTKAAEAMLDWINELKE